MKKGLKFGLVIAMALAMVMAFTACGSGNSSSGSSDKKYIIATDTTYAPFEFEDKNGKRVGIDMDLLKAIAKDQHFDYTVKALGFNAAVQSLESDQSDAVIAGMSITSERKKKFDFSDPYFDSGVGMAVNAKGQPLKLVGKLQAGNSYGFAVHKGKNAELLKKFNKGLKNLKDSGEYDKIVNKYVKKK